MMKYCSKCKQQKSFDAFVKNKSKKDGLSTECKPCKKLQGTEYYQKNKSKVKEKAFEYRINNPKKVSQIKKIGIKLIANLQKKKFVFIEKITEENAMRYPLNIKQIKLKQLQNGLK